MRLRVTTEIKFSIVAFSHAVINLTAATNAIKCNIVEIVWIVSKCDF
jgi:hypothetical protein